MLQPNDVFHLLSQGAESALRRRKESCQQRRSPRRGSRQRGRSGWQTVRVISLAASFGRVTRERASGGSAGSLRAAGTAGRAWDDCCCRVWSRGRRKTALAECMHTSPIPPRWGKSSSGIWAIGKLGRVPVKMTITRGTWRPQREAFWDTLSLRFFTKTCD